MLGRTPWGTVLPPDGAAPVRAEAFAAALAALWPGEVRRHSSEWLARDGSRRRVDWTDSLVPGAAGSARFIVSVGVDVAAREAAEAALQRSEAQLRQAQQVARLACWRLDHASGQLDRSDEVFALPEIDRRRCPSAAGSSPRRRMAGCRC